MEKVTIIKDFFIEYWAVILPLVYELAARLWPTEKNRSIIDLVYKILSVIVPNKKKVLPIIVFMLMSLGALAQLNGNFKSVRFVNVLDSTTVLPIEATIYYNEQSKKFRCYVDGQWVDCIAPISGGGSGSSYTVGSGLTLSNDSINIGGVMFRDSELGGNGVYSFSLGSFNTGPLVNLNSFATNQTLLSLNNFSVNAFNEVSINGTEGTTISGGNGDLILNTTGGVGSVDITTNSGAVYITSNNNDVDFTANNGYINGIADEGFTFNTNPNGDNIETEITSDSEQIRIASRNNDTFQSSRMEITPDLFLITANNDVDIRSSDSKLTLMGDNVDLITPNNMSISANASMYIESVNNTASINAGTSYIAVGQNELSLYADNLPTTSGTYMLTWDQATNVIDAQTIPGGGGGSTGANGLNGTTIIELGGTFTKNTDISGTFDFSLGGGGGSNSLRSFKTWSNIDNQFIVAGSGLNSGISQYPGSISFSATNDNVSASQLFNFNGTGSSINGPTFRETRNINQTTGLTVHRHNILSSNLGTVTAGFGVSNIISLETNNAGGNTIQEAYQQNVYWNDPTNGAEKATIQNQISLLGTLNNYHTINTSSSDLRQTLNGIIVMPNLPTACGTYPAGTLWNDLGTLKICP